MLAELVYACQPLSKNIIKMQHGRKGRDDNDHDDRNEEEYFLPLEDQRVFGAGIKRKRIAFVPASTSHNIAIRPGQETKALESPGDRYLSIVLGKKSSHVADSTAGSPIVRSQIEPEVALQRKSEPQPLEQMVNVSTCPVCKQVLSSDLDDGNPQDAGSIMTRSAHEASIAHQVCLQHSHPPSHLDRNHVGLKYLAEYGWDPDSRRGLGATGAGIRVPVKTREKQDTSGLGVALTSSTEEDEYDASGRRVARRKNAARAQEKVVKLDAKGLKRVEDEKKKRAEKLRHAFYGEDLSQYLGPEL